MPSSARKKKKNVEPSRPKADYECAGKFVRQVMRALDDVRATTLVSFFFNDTATTEIYTLSLHDALPIRACQWCTTPIYPANTGRPALRVPKTRPGRSSGVFVLVEESAEAITSPDVEVRDRVWVADRCG